MKKVMGIIMSFVLAITLTVTASGTVATEYLSDDLYEPLGEAKQTAAATDLKIAAKSAILMEPRTMEILYEQNSDERVAPASITKIMSLLLIMEAIDDGRLTLDTVVTASEHAASMGGSQIWLEPNEQMTVDHLLKATVIASANDATTALAEAVAGSEETFVSMMNEKAEKLGMTNTHFMNCSGLDADNHYTSAHDVAIMSCELIKHELIKKYSTVWMDTIRDGKSELVNTNKLVRFYEGCTGLKTGTTSTAGHCLSATAKRDNMELCAVVMGGESGNARFEGARTMLNYGFANYSYTEISPDDMEDAYVKVLNGKENQVKVRAGDNLNLLLSKGNISKITKKTEITPEIKAPVSEGQVIGYVRVYMGEDNEIGVIELKADKTVEKLNITTAFLRLLKSLTDL